MSWPSQEKKNLALQLCPFVVPRLLKGHFSTQKENCVSSGCSAAKKKKTLQFENVCGTRVSFRKQPVRVGVNVGAVDQG